MDRSTAVSLVVIASAAVIAPVLSELLRRWRIPTVLFELLLGILIGPSLLGWVEVDGFVGGLSELGLAMLFFMAGYEIDFARLKGAPLRLGTAGWILSLVLGLAAGAVLAFEGLVVSSLLIGLALTTTAIGTLLPMLRDREQLGTRFGSFVLAAGAVGEFGPVLAITILLSAASPLHESLLLIVFVVLTLGVAVIATRPQRPEFIEVLQRHLTTSSQLPVRILLLLLTVMVLAAGALGLDNLLGAFAAGLIARLALSPAQSAELTPRLEAIGFGFLIPVFFIVSGVQFDLRSLLGSPVALASLPLFLLLMFVVRGLPAVALYRKVLPGRERWAMALMQATALPLLVVISQIGISEHDMSAEAAAVLVGAGMLSVLVFPLIAFSLLGRDPDATDTSGTQTLRR